MAVSRPCWCPVRVHPPVVLEPFSHHGRPSRMRRMLAIGVTAVLFTTGCGRPLPSHPQAALTQAAPTQAAPTQAATTPAVQSATGRKQAEVYEQVLRRYLSTPAENSFPGKAFKTVYVFDHVQSEAADPVGTTQAGTPIPSDVQTLITASLAQTAAVTFIADKGNVLDTSAGCASVRDGGILITLGTIDGDDNRATVGLNGYVACLAATWLTYVVHHQPGTGWKVTGTTGAMAIA